MDPRDTDDDDDAGGSRLARWGGGAAAVGFLGLLGWGVWKLSSEAPPPKSTVQQVAILRQQPPPPPPKPPEKPPEPPKIKEEVKIDQPQPEQPKPADQPPDDKPASDKPLGVDADGAAGSDGFGLAANRGGRDLLLTGSGSGGATGRYYTGLLQRNFFEALARNRKMPQGEFSVVVSVLLGDDGRVQQAQIVTGSGDPEIDQLIQATLAEMPALRDVPPPNLRQVQLRLNRRA